MACAWLVALALAGVPSGASARAHAPPTPPVDPAATDATTGGTDVGAMWREANAKLATSDYAGAIVLLTRVYEQIGQDPDARLLRMRVRWALHEAHVGAHGVDEDARHLYVARDLLGNGMHDFGADDAELRARSTAAIAELDARIAVIEQSQRDREAAERQRLADERTREQAQADARTRATPAPSTVPKPAAGRAPPRRGLLIGGSVAGGVGVLGLAMVAGGFGSAARAVDTFESDPAERDAARDDVALGNAIGIAGAVIAAVGITVAAITIPLSLRRGATSTARASREHAWTWQGIGVGTPARFGWSAHDVRRRHPAR